MRFENGVTGRVQELIVARRCLEQWAFISQIRELAGPEDAVPRAAVEVRNVHKIVSGASHELDYFCWRIFIAPRHPVDHCLH